MQHAMQQCGEGACREKQLLLPPLLRLMHPILWTRQGVSRCFSRARSCTIMMREGASW